MFSLSEFHVIKTNRNTRGIAGGICCFPVNQNFVLSEFMLTGFHSMPHDHSDEPGVDCRGNPDGGESDEILTIPVQVSDP